MHVVVVRSTFRSQNAQNASVSEHFWQLRCSKSARRYGAKSAFGGENAKDNVATLFCVAGARDSALSKTWQAWDIICRGSAKMHFAWQVRYKRHMSKTCLEAQALIS